MSLGNFFAELKRRNVYKIAVGYGVVGWLVMQVALAWLLQHSPVMLPIPGTSSVAHLEENVAAARLKLTSAEVETLNRIAPPR